MRHERIQLDPTCHLSQWDIGHHTALFEGLFDLNRRPRCRLGLFLPKVILKKGLPLPNNILRHLIHSRDDYAPLQRDDSAPPPCRSTLRTYTPPNSTTTGLSLHTTSGACKLYNHLPFCERGASRQDIVFTIYRDLTTP